MTTLIGKVALVTGASSGIGAATAKTLAEAGAMVGIAARRADRLEALKAEIEQSGGQALVLEMDVANKNSVDAGVKKLLNVYGALDIVFNNAGIMPLSNIDDFETDEWDRMVDVNIKGVLNVTAAVLPQMIEQHSGHIVNTSSIAGRKVFGQGFAVYSATKFAVSAFTEGLRMEVGKKHNIRVTSIQPGATATELPQQTTSAEYLEMMAAYASQLQPLNPEDIAQTVLFAVSAPEQVNIAELFVLPTSQV
ncbi:SDR family oxidoreductase [Pseudomonas lijiangensis]|uniref:SDR family oxidoreductase n=1 Tax=Pseudomonas syringae group TaxID=136849 RepID=UPI0018E5BDDA|nr:SDR family oxidoreductase [Pseudomonas cichorii]MBI6854929.1 SDR family oxidoreductase [Pseudomonas cichorii]